MLVLVGWVALATRMLPRHTLVGWGGGVALAMLFAVLLRVRLHGALAQVEWYAQKLPQERAVSAKNMPLELDGTLEGLRQAGARIRSMVEAADEDRAELESVMDSMQDAVVAVDASGRIQWANERMEKLMPWGQAGTVRVGHALVQTVRDPEVLECVRLALVERAVEVRRSTSLLPGRIFEVNASPMPGGGAVAVLHDITRIEEMEEAQRDFVANVSHELRTPLTSISGYVETLLDHEKLSVQAREFLQTILKNATRMNRLTEDLLVMARVERPAAELRRAPVPADALMRDAVKIMSGLAAEDGAQLEMGEVTNCQVFADTDAVMQVLSNLIENAVKYGIGRGGAARVVLRARVVAEPHEAVEFSVQDFGAGIASEHLPRIFERFYRVDKTRSRESGGTGLGLAIARHMVQVQGGAIWAESELGAGSRFVFTLPKALYPVTLSF